MTLQMRVSLLMVLVMLWLMTTQSSSQDVKPDCAMDEHFFLNCSSNDGGDELWFRSNMTAHIISVLEGTVTVSIAMKLGPGSFTFSDTLNIFTAIGCDTAAEVTNEEFTYRAACLSLCTKFVNMTDENTCSGSGCCQASIPMGLKSLDISSYSISTTRMFRISIPVDLHF
ncbi:WALL-ASSOCIATED RECEPTOR KINASE 2-LIKE [Salix purpurea]|uniref:WALL-ASSOCIATED RECEPTOR KINASE 2-LIKE n=1 Tax=Salix purpurea TaxID=77065 RepID=A0A9Q1ABT7_SALPP|nr:WALL-ASSOCIATED RECEPTOR KINASE 2-LIKE [Salix purpurea]